MSVEVNISTAHFFWDQITGEYNGHMAKIPNNPVLRSLLISHDANTKTGFIEFLRSVADQLEKEEPDILF